MDHLPTPAPPRDSPEPEAPKWHLDLGRNQVDSSRFPAAAWARLTRQVLSEGNFLAPVPQQGLYALRQAIARDLWDFKGMAVAPEQIVVGAGAEYLYLLLAQLLGANGRTVLPWRSRAIPKSARSTGSAALSAARSRLDCQGMDPEALAASGAMAAHISPAHHYPTGLVTPIGRRHALLRWAEASDGFIIEDDYDSEFRYHGKPIPAMQGLDDGENVIYMGTFSKAIAPAIRASYMVLPKKLAKRYQQIGQTFSCAVSRIDQKVLTLFLTEGHFERHLNRMRNIYKEKHDLLIKEIKKLNSDIQIYGHGAGAHIIVRFPVSDQKEFQKN